MRFAESGIPAFRTATGGEKRCLIIRFFFHSPELLEGLMVLGERSNQSVFWRKRLTPRLFFRRLG